MSTLVSTLSTVESTESTTESTAAIASTAAIEHKCHAAWGRVNRRGGDGRGMGLALATLQTKHTLRQGDSRVDGERVPCVVHTPELMRMPGNTNVTPPGAVFVK